MRTCFVLFAALLMLCVGCELSTTTLGSNPPSPQVVSIVAAEAKNVVGEWEVNLVFHGSYSWPPGTSEVVTYTDTTSSTWSFTVKGLETGTFRYTNDDFYQATGTTGTRTYYEAEGTWTLADGWMTRAWTRSRTGPAPFDDASTGWTTDGSVDIFEAVLVDGRLYLDDENTYHADGPVDGILGRWVHKNRTQGPHWSNGNLWTATYLSDGRVQMIGQTNTDGSDVFPSASDPLYSTNTLSYKLVGDELAETGKDWEGITKVAYTQKYLVRLGAPGSDLGLRRP